MYINLRKQFLSGCLVLLLSMVASPNYAFSDVETKELMKQCVANTRQQYGYSLQLSRDYCHCSVTRTIAYMKQHNLKQGVKPPLGTDIEAMAKTFINIPVQCAREILAQ